MLYIIKESGALSHPDVRTYIRNKKEFQIKVFSECQENLSFTDFLGKIYYLLI